MFSDDEILELTRLRQRLHVQATRLCDLPLSRDGLNIGSDEPFLAERVGVLIGIVSELQDLLL